MSAAVQITTAFSLEDDCWRIYCTSHGRTEVAGPRILRAAPHPEIQYSHATEAGAIADAAKLRAYLDGLGKGPSRAKVRASGAT